MRQFIDIVEGSQVAAITLENELRDLAQTSGIVIDIARNDDLEISLENLNTPEGLRGKGLAKRFMKRLSDRADDLGVTVWVYAHPYEGNVDPASLRAFYRQFGFVNVDGEETGYMVRQPAR